MKLNLPNLIKSIKEGTSKMRLKQINEVVEKLSDNSEQLENYLKNAINLKNIDYFTVVYFLIKLQIKLTDLKVPLNLVKNVYDQYSIIFVLNILGCSLSKSEENKIIRIFVDILSNSSKFDIYSKVNKNVKLTSSAVNQLNELFWLCPFFSKPNILTSMNYNKFIDELKLIAINDSNFTAGYLYYVIQSPIELDTKAFKLYLSENSK